MLVFVFQSRKDTTITCYTARPDGANLPANLAPWRKLGAEDQQPGGHIAGVPHGADTVLAVIKAEGLLVTDIVPRVAIRTG